MTTAILDAQVSDTGRVVFTLGERRDPPLYPGPAFVVDSAVGSPAIPASPATVPTVTLLSPKQITNARIVRVRTCVRAPGAPSVAYFARWSDEWVTRSGVAPIGADCRVSIALPIRGRQFDLKMTVPATASTYAHRYQVTSTGPIRVVGPGVHFEPWPRRLTAHDGRAVQRVVVDVGRTGSLQRQDCRRTDTGRRCWWTTIDRLPGASPGRRWSSRPSPARR